MTKEQIRHMVDRFLSWKLPEHFSPDDGISFEPIAGKDGPHPFKREPSGTNLFDATQAEAMVRHMIEGLPDPGPASAMSDAEALQMMNRCKHEIMQLREEIARLRPKAEAYDNLGAVLRLLPQPSRGMSEDLVWVLDKRIQELNPAPTAEA